MDYFSADQLEPQAIAAALSHGTIEPWRKDPGGVQWYRRTAATTFHTMAGVEDLDEDDEHEAPDYSQAVQSVGYLDDFADDVPPNNVWRKVL